MGKIINKLELQNQINERISVFEGKKVSELKEVLGVMTDNKSSFVKVSKKMLGISSNQFTLSNGTVEAVLKTVRITGTSTMAESMSFMQVDFDEWMKAPDWHSSELYRYFKEKVFVFFIFQQYPSGKKVADEEMTFLKATVWKMSDYDLEHGLKEVWDEVRNLVGEGKLKIESVEQKGGRRINKNNLPSITFNGLGHLRPGGKNGQDTVDLPDGQKIVRQRFWLNANYVKEMIGM